MRRMARPLTGTALAVLTPALTAALLLPSAPAYGGEDRGRLELTPADVIPGDEVTARTAACGADGTGAGDASAVGAGSFPLAPGAGRPWPSGRFEVPPSAQPGTYEIVATCAKGGRRVAGDLVVSLTGGHSAPPAPPRGSVKTGVGGALGTDPVQTAAGVAALAVAAAGGTWLLHRRARGDRI
ncbi:hypothetical protein ACFZCL_06370 [Streptomyces sp. NPDC008159]|uniref:hypothetical protein n=1 Tax=Streptomyces sp. NPDC008159 TaxID=3364817 RepID=UPI0036EAEAB2